MMSLEALRQKARWVRAETLKLHKLAPGTRIASSLSDVEILVVLYYCSASRSRLNWGAVRLSS